jgi:hypothetical protein
MALWNGSLSVTHKQLSVARTSGLVDSTDCRRRKSAWLFAPAEPNSSPSILNPETFSVKKSKRPVPQIITRIPRRQMTRSEWNQIVTLELLQIWETLLSPEEHQATRATDNDGGFAPPSVEQKLDDLILNQAQTLGWRIVFSDLVLKRFNKWESQENGPRLFEELGRSFAKSTKIFQQKLKPPLDPDLRQFRTETVTELRVLLRNIKNVFSVKRRAPGQQEILATFETLASNDSFPHLRANLAVWLDYLGEDVALRSFSSGSRISPAALFDSWLGWCQNRDAESLRQAISELPNSAQDQRSTKL